MSNVTKILKKANRCAADGLLDVSALEALKIGPERSHGEAINVVNGVEASDKQFVDWVCDRLRMHRGEERLNARLLLLAVLEESGRIEKVEHDE